MMVLLDGERFGKAGSRCKPSWMAFTLLFISVCNMWVRIRYKDRGFHPSRGGFPASSSRAFPGSHSGLVLPTLHRLLDLPARPSVGFSVCSLPERWFSVQVKSERRTAS